jgi:hypothetical protein
MNNRKQNYMTLIFQDDDSESQYSIKVKNLGQKTFDILNKQISCIQGVADQINDCEGLSEDEITLLLKQFYGHEVIHNKERIEPYNYGRIDVFDNWERYAQDQNYNREADELYAEGLKEAILTIMKEHQELNDRIEEMKRIEQINI